jgi:hypothetical protein
MIELKRERAAEGDLHSIARYKIFPQACKKSGQKNERRK